MSETPKELTPYRLLRDSLPTDESRRRHVTTSNVGDQLRACRRILSKHRSVGVSAFLVIVVTVAFVNLTATPLYTARARIEIQRQAPKVSPVQGLEQFEAPSTVDRYDFYKTQFEILASRRVAARVIRGLALESNARFMEEVNAQRGAMSTVREWLWSFRRVSGRDTTELGVRSRTIDHYLARLSINPVYNSRLVVVSFTSKDPELAAAIANRHVDDYVNASFDQRLSTTIKAKDFLGGELAKAKDRVVATEAALNGFRKAKGIISIDGGKSDVVSARLSDLNERFTEAQADRIRLEAQHGLISRRDYESLPDVLASSLVTDLKQELSKIENERAELARKVGPNYPTMQEVLAREAQAKRRLKAEVQKIVGGIESAYQSARRREDELGEHLREQKAVALAQKDVGADFDTLQRDVDTARALYANLLQRLKDVDVAEEIRISNVSTVDEAVAPSWPSSPNVTFNMTLAVAAGLLFATGLAFFLEHLDNTLKTPEDVSQKLGLPTLGIVPSFETKSLAYGKPEGVGHPTHGNGSATDRDLVVANRPSSVPSEAYRAIRTAILLSNAGRPPRVVVYTSPSAGDGKTVTAINEAITLSLAGGRVLLIDADTRKPRVHKLFAVGNAHGLSTFLAGQSSLEEVIHPVPVNGKEASVSAVAGTLAVVPAGPIPPNPAELVGSARMRDMLAFLRERYDYILIDSPPVLPVTDAVLLAAMSDGVVLVVRGQQTPIEIAAKSRERLEYAQAKILGVVLNDVDVTTADYGQYHRYYYSSYYSARSDEA